MSAAGPGLWGLLRLSRSPARALAGLWGEVGFGAISCGFCWGRDRAEGGGEFPARVCIYLPLQCVAEAHHENVEFVCPKISFHATAPCYRTDALHKNRVDLVHIVEGVSLVGLEAQFEVALDAIERVLPYLERFAVDVKRGSVEPGAGAAYLALMYAAFCLDSERAQRGNGLIEKLVDIVGREFDCSVSFVAETHFHRVSYLRVYHARPGLWFLVAAVDHAEPQVSDAIARLHGAYQCAGGALVDLPVYENAEVQQVGQLAIRGGVLYMGWAGVGDDPVSHELFDFLGCKPVGLRGVRDHAIAENQRDPLGGAFGRVGCSEFAALDGNHRFISCSCLL